MGLSRLQKTILELASRNGKEYLTPAPVKATYYGFPMSPRGRKLHFDKDEVGHDRYNNASVAISRAFGRMEQKGLIEWRQSWGIKLTDKGRELAQQIRND